MSVTELRRARRRAGRGAAARRTVSWSSRRRGRAVSSGSRWRSTRPASSRGTTSSSGSSPPIARWESAHPDGDGYRYYALLARGARIAARRSRDRRAERDVDERAAALAQPPARSRPRPRPRPRPRFLSTGPRARWLRSGGRRRSRPAGTAATGRRHGPSVRGRGRRTAVGRWHDAGPMPTEYLLVVTLVVLRPRPRPRARREGVDPRPVDRQGGATYDGPCVRRYRPRGRLRRDAAARDGSRWSSEGVDRSATSRTRWLADRPSPRTSRLKEPSDGPAPAWAGPMDDEPGALLDRPGVELEGTGPPRGEGRVEHVERVERLDAGDQVVLAEAVEGAHGEPAGVDRRPFLQQGLDLVVDRQMAGEGLLADRRDSRGCQTPAARRARTGRSMTSKPLRTRRVEVSRLTRATEPS